MNMEYMGGYTSDGSCCEGSAGVPMQMAPGTVITTPQGTVTPGPVAE